MPQRPHPIPLLRDVGRHDPRDAQRSPDRRLKVAGRVEPLALQRGRDDIRGADVIGLKIGTVRILPLDNAGERKDDPGRRGDREQQARHERDDRRNYKAHKGKSNNLPGSLSDPPSHVAEVDGLLLIGVLMGWIVPGILGVGHRQRPF